MVFTRNGGGGEKGGWSEGRGGGGREEGGERAGLEGGRVGGGRVRKQISARNSEMIVRCHGKN